MKNTMRIYDWPTRIFHWLFVGSFLAAFAIAKTLDDESAAFPFHMLLGLTLSVAVVLRVIWGLLGSRYARFASFQLRPTELLSYFTNLVTRNGARYAGHNPASSWAALVMMALALGLGVSGYLMTSSSGNKETFEDLHELMANAFAVVAGMHVAGIILHTLMHRDAIGMSMIHGSKRTIAGQTAIQRSHWGLGLLLIALVGGFVFHLSKNYDPTQRTLTLLGTTLQLGENEESMPSQELEPQEE